MSSLQAAVSRVARRLSAKSAGVSEARADEALFLNRQLSLPVSTMSQWWVSWSSMAVVILASPKTCGQSAMARLVVRMIEVFSQSLLIKWNSCWLPAWLKGR
jgi:hypothetical protein